MLLDSRRVVLSALVLALCCVGTRGVVLLIIQRQVGGILDVRCRVNGLDSDGAFFHIRNLITDVERSQMAPGDYTININKDSNISCSEFEDSERSPTIPFPAIPQDQENLMEHYCRYEDDTSVLLECPFSPGFLEDNYEFNWLDIAPRIQPNQLNLPIIEGTFDANLTDVLQNAIYSCQLKFTPLCGNPGDNVINCGGTVRRRGPQINITTYGGPNITQSPSDKTVASGNFTSFSCVADGDGGGDGEIVIEWVVTSISGEIEEFEECEDNDESTQSFCFERDIIGGSTLEVNTTTLNGDYSIICMATQTITANCDNDQFNATRVVSAPALLTVVNGATDDPETTPTTDTETTPPSTPPPSPPTTSGNLPLAISVGSAVGGLVVALLLIVIIICLCVVCVCRSNDKTGSEEAGGGVEGHYEEVSPSCFQAAPEIFKRQMGIDESNQRALYAELPYYNSDNISAMGQPESVYGGSQYSGHSSRSGGYVPMSIASSHVPYQIPGTVLPNINVFPSASMSTIPGQPDPQYTTLHPVPGGGGALPEGNFTGEFGVQLSQGSNTQEGNYSPRLLSSSQVFQTQIPAFPSPQHRQALVQQTISSQLQLMVLDYLMHNENCQIPFCMCRQLKSRRQALLYQNPEYMPQRAAREFCQQEQKAADPQDRRHQLHLTLSNHNLHENSIHPHYHLSKNSHNLLTRSRKEHLRAATPPRQRSKSLSDLTPHEEETASQLCSPAAIKSPFITRPQLGDDDSEPDCGLIDVEVEKPPYLREISISADNIPALCVNDCPLTPSPLKTEYRVLGSPMRPQMKPWPRPSIKTPLQTVQERTISTASSDSNESNTSSRSVTPVQHERGNSDINLSNSDEDQKYSPSASNRREQFMGAKRSESGYDTETQSEPTSAGNSGRMRRKSREGSAGFEPQPSPQRTYMQQDSGLGDSEYQARRLSNSARKRGHSNEFSNPCFKISENGAGRYPGYQLEERAGGKVSVLTAPRGHKSGSHTSLNEAGQNETLV